jgi:AAHS family 4-hydroxybenzoate transporter-like MFS transporter
MDARIASFRQALDARKTSSFHYWLLLLVALLLITDGYDTQSIGYVAPALVKAWGVSRPALAPVFSLGLFGVMIGAIAMTTLADKLGARRIILACAGLYGVLSLATALVTDISGLQIMRFLTGMALGGAMPAAIALISEYAPTRVRATMVTVGVCGFSIGGALGGVVATAAIGNYGWQAVFVVGGIAPLLLLPVLAFTLPESLPRLLTGKAGARAERVLHKLVPGWTPPPAGEVKAQPFGLPVAGLFADGRAMPTLLIWLVFFMNLLMLYTLSNWLPTIMTSDGVSMKAANFATTFYQLGGAFGGLLIAFLCDKLSVRSVLPLVFLGASVFVYLIGTVGGDPTLAVIIIGAAGFCVVGGQGAANAFAGNYYPSEIRNSGIGWALGIGRLGSILGPLLVGWLIKQGVETKTLFQLCAIPGLFSAAAIWLAARGPSEKSAAALVASPADLKP